MSQYNVQLAANGHDPVAGPVWLGLLDNLSFLLTALFGASILSEIYRRAVETSELG